MGLPGLEAPQPKKRGAGAGRAEAGKAGSAAAEDVKPSKSAAETAARAAIHAGVERVEREMDRKWGRGRLPQLVSSELASKFASAKEKYEATRRLNSLVDVEHRAEVLKRGYGALNAFCEASGMVPLPGNWWVATDAVGNRFILCKERADVDLIPREESDGAAVWTVEEVMRVLKFAGLAWANELKREFGNFTELTRLGDPASFDMMEDSEPF